MTALAAPARPAPTGQPRRRRHRRYEAAGLGFASPMVLLSAVFLMGPMVFSFVYSFAKISSLSGTLSWVGLTNYETMFSDPVFFRSLVNTALFTVLTVPGSMALGLALAILLNSLVPGRLIYRTIVYLPLVVSGVAVGLIGTFFYNETVGVIDSILVRFSLPAIPWQSDGFWAFVSVVLVTLWTRVGLNMIVYLAGLQGVPVELQEAAQVEGANGRQRFWNITLPLLGPSTFFLLILDVIYSFQVFDIVFVLTNGGPQSATEVLGTYAYKTAFGSARDQGYGSAIGVVIFLLTLVFAAIQWRANKTRDEVA